MEYLAIKILIIASASTLLLVEELRRHSITNKKLILFAFLILVKEIGTWVLYMTFGDDLSSQYFFYQYVLYWLPAIWFFHTVHLNIVNKKKSFLLPGILFCVMFLITALVFQFQEYVSGYMLIMHITIRLVFVLAAIFVIVNINTVYVADRTGVLVKSLPIVIGLIGLYSFNFLILASPKFPFHAILDSITYVVVFVLFYRKNHFGYDQLNNTIEEYEKELNSIFNLMNKSGVGAGNVSDFNEITDSILQYVCEMINARSGILLITTSDKNYLLPRGFFGAFPPLQGGENYASIKKQHLDMFNRNVRLKVGDGYIGKAAQSKKSAFYKVAKDYEEFKEQSKVVDVETVIAHPLLYKDEQPGAIAFCNKEDKTLFTDQDYNLSETLAQHVAIIMNNFRFYNELIRRQRDERELEIAGTIQKNLLPRSIPETKHADIFTFNRPAKDVGGDYYNIIHVDEKRMDVVIADVAGKGVPASLVMVMISTVLKNIIKSNYGPRRIIAFLNRFLCRESTMERYATLSYVSVDVEQNILQFTNSGHSPLVMYKAATGKFEQIDTPGIPLGIDADQNYLQKQADFHEGDIIALYTDGITEAMNEQNDMFGFERLCRTIKEHHKEKADDIGQALLNEIEMFAAGAEQHDDMTLIIVKKT